MTSTVSVSRETPASADLLWAMISDVTRMGEWSPETTSAAWLKGATAPVAGARFRGRNRNGKKRWSTVATVLEAEPGRRFSFRIAVGPLQVADWIYEFEPTDGGCRVTEQWVDRRGRIGKAIGGPASGVNDRATHNRASMEQTLERLCAAAEAGAGQP
jgi:uncharacterized protein YndB with AHSA1/START domain